MTLGVQIKDLFLIGRTEVVLSSKETGKILKKFKYNNNNIKDWSEKQLIYDAVCKYNNLKHK